MNHRRWISLIWIPLIAAAFFAALAPTLPWPQFSDDSEDIVVQTVLEMRHGGPWWVPTLEGVPRYRKPPLVNWLSALSARPATIAQLPTRDPAQRDHVYRQLALEVRWPHLLAACLMLAFIGWTGQILGGPRFGICALLIAGSSLLFLRFVRLAAPDTQLACWVSAFDLFLAVALIQKRYWIGCLGAGAALGLALMSKGPAAFVYTLPGCLLFAIPPRPTVTPPIRKPKTLLPLLAGITLALAVAAPWFASALLGHQQALRDWQKEIQAEGMGNISHDLVIAHLSLLPMMLPWLFVFLGGLMQAERDLVRHGWRTQPIVLPLVQLLIPIVLLSCFPDRKERYLLPLVGPAALIAAWALRFLLSNKPHPQDRLLATLHWGTMLVLLLGLPVAGFFLATVDQTHWAPLPMLVGVLAAGIALLALAARFQPRSPLLLPLLTAVGMLMLNGLFIYGWSNTTNGRSEMKVVADRLRQDLPPSGKVAYLEILRPIQPGKPVTLDLDIYMDQPIRVIHDPAQAQDAAALVMLDRDAATLPAWPRWFDMISRKHHWFALRPPSPITHTTAETPGSDSR